MKRALTFARNLVRAGKELFGEVASRGSDPDFIGGLAVLPNPDRVLRKLGRSEDVFEDILADSHAYAQAESRLAATLGIEWEIVAGGGDAADRRIAEFCSEVLSPEMIRGAIEALLMAPLYGRAYVEVMWERHEGVVPVALAGRPQRRFGYAEDGTLRVLTRTAQLTGEPAPERKILQCRHRATYDNPYGEAALSRCFWPYTFKHAGWKFWVLLAEKYGIPMAVGKLPRGASDEDRRRLLDALESLVQDAIAVIPGDGSVEIHEADAASKGQLHGSLIAACNAEISKAIVGQTLTAEVGANGSYAAAQTHQEVRRDIAEGDRQLAAGALNMLLAWMAELNAPAAMPPLFRWVVEEARADWREHLLGAQKLGIAIPRAWAHGKLNIPIPSKGEDVIAAPSGGGSFAATPGGATYAAASSAGGDAAKRLGELAVKAAARGLGQWERTLLDVVDAAESLDELQYAVLEAFARLPVAAVAEPLEWAAVAAELNGRFLEGVDRDFDEERPLLLQPVPPADAIAFFKDRMPLSAEVAGQLHDQAKLRAFWVGGVQRESVVSELHGAVLKSLESGTGLREFKKDAGAILSRAGLSEIEPWRLETTFLTHVHQAYTVGRYRQMTDPDVLARRPFWQYRTMGDDAVRPTHRALDGRVFRADDPIWDRIYPPNGFRCRCEVQSMSEREVRARGIDVPGPGAGAAVTAEPDKGWDFNPGRAAWGGIERHVVAKTAPKDRQGWEVIGEGGAKKYGLEGVPVATVQTDTRPMPPIEAFGNLATDRAGTLQRAWRRLLKDMGAPEGAEDMFFQTPLGDVVRINRRFFDHVTEAVGNDDKARSRVAMLPFVKDAAERPSEIWLVARRSKDTGMVKLRRQVIGRFESADATVAGMSLVLEFERGEWAGWTAIPTKKGEEKWREGILLRGSPGMTQLMRDES